jgi:hypothetical protein
MNTVRPNLGSLMVRLAEISSTEISEGEALKLMKSYFQMHRKSNEYLFTTYDILDMVVDAEISDVDSLENIGDYGYMAQNFDGTAVVNLDNVIADPSTDKVLKNLCHTVRGNIYYYFESIVAAVKRVTDGKLTELTVKAFLSFAMGHERCHTTQSEEFIMEGRNVELSGALRDAPDATNIDSFNEYINLPSEVEADEFGYAHMQEVLGDEISRFLETRTSEITSQYAKRMHSAFKKYPSNRVKRLTPETITKVANKLYGEKMKCISWEGSTGTGVFHSMDQMPCGLRYNANKFTMYSPEIQKTFEDNGFTEYLIFQEYLETELMYFDSEELTEGVIGLVVEYAKQVLDFNDNHSYGGAVSPEIILQKIDPEKIIERLSN